MSESGSTHAPVCGASGCVARVAAYGDVEPEVRDQIASLVERSYARRVLNISLYLAVIEMLDAGVLPGFAAFEGGARKLLLSQNSEVVLARALTQLRQPRPANEEFALALQDARLQAVCSLTYARSPAELPILRHLALPEAALPRFMRALEIGRLSSVHSDDAPQDCRPNRAPFLVFHAALTHAANQGWLECEQDIICGGTHGLVLEMLIALGFPITTISPALTHAVFDLESSPLALSNLPRLVLGQLSHSQLQRALQALAWRDPARYQRVSMHMHHGYRQLQVPGDHDHVHELLGLRFFYFPWRDDRTKRAMHRLNRITERASRD